MLMKTASLAAVVAAVPLLVVAPADGATLRQRIAKLERTMAKTTKALAATNRTLTTTRSQLATARTQLATARADIVKLQQGQAALTSTTTAVMKKTDCLHYQSFDVVMASGGINPPGNFFTLSLNGASLGPFYVALLTPSCVTGRIIPQ